jgi:hypothetical protein
LLGITQMTSKIRSSVTNESWELGVACTWAQKQKEGPGMGKGEGARGWRKALIKNLTRKKVPHKGCRMMGIQ